MDDPNTNDVYAEEEFIVDDDMAIDMALPGESAENFKAKDSNIAWKWLLYGCGGGVLFACICCIATVAVLWYTGDALVEWLMGL